MKEKITYTTFDGCEYDFKNKAQNHEFKAIMGCFRFDYSNTTNEGGDTDFETYAVDRNETIKNILKLLKGI